MTIPMPPGADIDAALGEMRDNIAKMGEEAAQASFVQTLTVLTEFSPPATAFMCYVLAKKSLDLQDRLALVEEYARESTNSALQLSRGDMDAADASAQRARSLKARITGQGPS